MQATTGNSVYWDLPMAPAPEAYLLRPPKKALATLFLFGLVPTVGGVLVGAYLVATTPWAQFPTVKQFFSLLPIFAGIFLLMRAVALGREGDIRIELGGESITFRGEAGTEEVRYDTIKTLSFDAVRLKVVTASGDEHFVHRLWLVGGTLEHLAQELSSRAGVPLEKS